LGNLNLNGVTGGVYLKLGLNDGENEGLNEGDILGEGDGEGLGEGDGEGLGEGDGEGLKLGLKDLLGDLLFDGLNDGENEGLKDGLKDIEGDITGLGVKDLLNSLCLTTPLSPMVSKSLVIPGIISVLNDCHNTLSWSCGSLIIPNCFCCDVILV
jgi:hypothetical protein